MLLALPLVNVAHGATVKAGATCTKLNSTQIVGGMKFTCIKSGKKLVWNSGVPISPTKPAPTPTPSPSPSQSPSPTPSPSQSPSPSPSSSQKPVVVTEGRICDKTGPSEASDSTGKVLYCVAGSDGVFSWRPSNQSNNNSNSAQGPSASPYSLGMLGSACSSEGKISWNGLVVAI